MRKPETAFINSVHAHIPVDLYHLKQHNMYAGGPADMWYSGTSDDLWIEYKFIALPKRADTVIDIPGEFSALQLEWLRERYIEGRNVCAVIGCKEGGVILLHRDWEKPLAASKFAAKIIKRKSLGLWITNQVTLGEKDVRKVK